jgi:hypothetical protein
MPIFSNFLQNKRTKENLVKLAARKHFIWHNNNCKVIKGEIKFQG